MGTKKETYFITGFPGAVARRVASTLLKNTSNKLIVLVEPEHKNKALVLKRKADNRVTILTGSLDKIDFGLSGSDYLKIASRITKILHLQLPVPTGAKSSKDRQATREVIELGRVSKKISNIMILSHIDVAGDANGSFAEHDLNLSQKFINEPQEDRFYAERIYRNFMNTLPITILRTGWIVGDSFGLCPLAYLILAADDSMLSSLKAKNSPIYINPFEQTTKIIANIAHIEPPSNGLTLHLTCQEIPLVSQLIDQIHQIASSQVPFGFERATGALRTLKKKAALKQWSVHNFIKMQPKNVAVSTSFTTDFLKQHSLEPLKIEEKSYRTLTIRTIEEILGFK